MNPESVNDTHEVVDCIVREAKLNWKEGIECSGIGAWLDYDNQVKKVRFTDDPKNEFSPKFLSAILQHYKNEIDSKKLICGGVASEGTIEIEEVKYKAIIINMLHFKVDKLISYITPYRKSKFLAT